ncbi:dihydrofolate reductase family protein [Hymenobacter sp. BT491]|uniref:dihydrofolate reductase family protein n=1 Tax=Hymenobacter sp. BT491 TaxID=2766779 RepID=UPI001653E30C|nr:dihydrofolate reductase family protein [Hymenobacter sp. BT491]MBC6991033.1 dihydrofolate reductase [Hymenobacter sp. BT491]
MGKITVAMYLSLDGVMGNPAWTAPYWNDSIAKFQSDLMYGCDALLLGRVTYQGFAAAWPKMEGQPGADRMNSLPKFVASTTLDTAEWNASLIKQNIPEEVGRLKQQPDQNLLIYGSGELIRTLMQHDLIDEYHLMVYPLVLGSGKRLFQEGVQTTLQLLDSKPLDKGVVGLIYAPVRA